MKDDPDVVELGEILDELLRRLAAGLDPLTGA